MPHPNTHPVDRPINLPSGKLGSGIRHMSDADFEAEDAAKGKGLAGPTAGLASDEGTPVRSGTDPLGTLEAARERWGVPEGTDPSSLSPSRVVTSHVATTDALQRLSEVEGNLTSELMDGLEGKDGTITTSDGGELAIRTGQPAESYDDAVWTTIAIEAAAEAERNGSDPDNVDEIEAVAEDVTAKAYEYMASPSSSWRSTALAEQGIKLRDYAEYQPGELGAVVIPLDGDEMTDHLPRDDQAVVAELVSDAREGLAGDQDATLQEKADRLVAVQRTMSGLRELRSQQEEALVAITPREGTHTYKVNSVPVSVEIKRSGRYKAPDKESAPKLWGAVAGAAREAAVGIHEPSQLMSGGNERSNRYFEAAMRAADVVRSVMPAKPTKKAVKNNPHLGEHVVTRPGRVSGKYTPPAESSAA